MNKEILVIEKQVNTLNEQAKELVITSEKELALASDILNHIKQVKNLITERKEAITRPLMESLSSARELFKPLETGYLFAEKTIKQKVIDYTTAEEERIEKEKARVIARGEKGTMREDTVIDKLNTIGEPKTSVHGERSLTSIRKVTKVRVIDESLIPREYLVVDMVKIGEAVLKKKINVPGTETYVEKVIASGNR